MSRSARLLIVLCGALAACGDDARLPLGQRCAADRACASDLCGAGVCLDPEADDDQDGLANGHEVDVGTQPLAADTDGDGLVDGAEFRDGAALDSDGDGRVDALESARADGDGDCLPDQLDPRDGAGDDLAPLIPSLCPAAGVCAAGGLSVVCKDGVARCEYAAVADYEADEHACDGRDNDCDGATDEGAPDLDRDGDADCVDPDRDGDDIADATDRCPDLADDQSDVDLDGVGDACDPPMPPIATGLAPASPGTDPDPVLFGLADRGATLAVWEAAACAGPPLATGVTAADGTFAIAVAVKANRETRFWLRADNPAGLASACVPSAFAYVHDDRAPDAPELDEITPPSPSADDTPRVDGSAEPFATVALHASAGCTGATLGVGEVDAAGRFSIVMGVATNAETTVHGVTIDRAGNRSVCATLASYTHDGQRPDPPRPHPTPFSPASPSTTTVSPILRGCADDGATVDLYDRIGCVGGLVASFTADAVDGDCADGSAFFGLVVASPNAATTFYGQTRNGSGVVSACVPLGTFVHDSVAPAAPVLDAVSPTSPSSVPTPTLIGTAEPYAAIGLYRDAQCSVSIGAGDADRGGHFAIVATVPTNTTTGIYGRASDAVGSTSACVMLTTYRHDGTQPAPPWPHPSVPFVPDSPSSSDDTPSVRGCAEADADVLVFATEGCGGEPVARLKAALDDTACGVGQAFGGTIPVSAPTTFRAVTENGIGLRSACATLGTYDFDDVAPAAPALVQILPVSPAATETPVVFGTAEPGTTVTLFRGAGCVFGVPLGTARVGPDGAWAIAGGLEAREGTTRFVARAQDEAGNLSGCASLGTWVHDSLPPSPPTMSAEQQAVSPSNDEIVRARLCAETGATVEVYQTADCSGAATDTAAVLGSSACGAGRELSFMQIVDRPTTFYARARDAAGNASACAPLFTYDFDVSPPAPPAVGRVRGTSWSLVDPQTIGSVAFEVRGVTEAGAHVTLFVDGAQVANVTADGDGAFVASIANVNARAAGDRKLQTRATDVAGNVGALGAALAIVGDVSLTFTQDGLPLTGLSAGIQYPDGTLFTSLASDQHGVVARRVFAGMMATWGWQAPLGPSTRRTLETFMDLMPGDSLVLALPETEREASPPLELSVGFPALANATGYLVASACGAVQHTLDAGTLAVVALDDCVAPGDAVDVVVLALDERATVPKVLAWNVRAGFELAVDDNVMLFPAWRTDALTSPPVALVNAGDASFAVAVGATQLSGSDALALLDFDAVLGPRSTLAVAVPFFGELGAWRRSIALATVAGLTGEYAQVLRHIDTGTTSPPPLMLDVAADLLPRVMIDPLLARGPDADRPRFGWLAGPGLAAADAAMIEIRGEHDCIGVCTDGGDPCDVDADCGERCEILQCAELVWRIAWRPSVDVTVTPPLVPNGFAPVDAWRPGGQRGLTVTRLAWLDLGADWEAAKRLGRAILGDVTSIDAGGDAGVARQTVLEVR